VQTVTYPEIFRTLPPGDAGAFQTLRAMGGYAKYAAWISSIRNTAAGFPGPCLWPDLAPQTRCHALRGYLATHFQFREDPPGAEMVRHPQEMLDAMARGEVPVRGDCDDAAALGAALALACRLQVRWRVLRMAPGLPYGHVYAEVKPQRGGSWVDLDVTRPAALPGLVQSLIRVSPPIPLD